MCGQAYVAVPKSWRAERAKTSEGAESTDSYAAGEDLYPISRKDIETWGAPVDFID